ncbi:MAG: nuclear transport factor 2 family protein [Acidobacteriota bacterium]
MDAVGITFSSRPLMDHFEEGDPECGSKHRERGHVQLIDRVYAAIGSGDSETLLQLLTPDASLTIEGFLDMDGRWEGAANILAACGRNFALVEGQQVSIERVCAQGDQLIILFQETGRQRSSGEIYDAHVVQWFHLADGRIDSIREIAVTKTMSADSRT